VKVESAEDEAKLAQVAGNFQFHQDVVPGEPLLTIGFGIAGNWSRQMMANQDSDCYVFSGQGEYRLMADPDRLNPGTYRAWSFSLGCDVSHGDSGSAIVDRNTGNVIGIIWTGRIPKSREVQSSSYLTRIFQSHDEKIWEELSYAVPAVKMREKLESELEQGKFPEGDRRIIQALLQ
jgi:hypothetical protein